MPTLPPDADLALFRALQEALSNVVRHSAAHAVDVRLRVESERVTLNVRDDGRGFPRTRDGRVRETEGRMGLTGMRERMLAVGGSVSLRNSETGAEVTMQVPVTVEVAR